MSDRERTEQLIARHLRQRKDKYEALAWLTEAPDPSKRSLAEWTNRESVRRIRELYARGAREIWAVAFDRNLPYESIHTLIIALPDDPSRRAAVFATADNLIQLQGYDPEPDHGHQHLYIWFD